MKFEALQTASDQSRRQNIQICGSRSVPADPVGPEKRHRPKEKSGRPGLAAAEFALLDGCPNPYGRNRRAKAIFGRFQIANFPTFEAFRCRVRLLNSIVQFALPRPKT